MSKYKTLREAAIFVEAPSWDDAEFYGKWLLAAAEAERLWIEATSTDPMFRERTIILDACRQLQFSIDAMNLIGMLYRKASSAVIPFDNVDIDKLDANSFAMMTLMGFFVLTGERYQMTIPSQLDSEIVKSACLRLLETEQESEDGLVYPHPENLLKMMSLATAQNWQQRLEKMDPDQRVSDRKLLLCEDPVQGQCSPFLSV